MTTTKPKTPTPQGAYHYVISLQFEWRNGVQPLSWQSGFITPAPGETRGDLFNRIMEMNSHVGANPVPLFFSLEPNTLATQPVTAPSGAGEDQ